MNKIADMETADTIADLVHHFIVRTGLTDAELGDLVGVHQSQISRWRRGVGVPRESYVVPLAEALDVDPEIVEAARVEGERLRIELAEKNEASLDEELRRIRSELRKARARIARLEQKLSDRR